MKRHGMKFQIITVPIFLWEILSIVIYVVKELLINIVYINYNERNGDNLWL